MAEAGQRSILFLQGPLSPLYARLADRLAAAGCQVHRVDLCFGDWLHWRRPGAIAYRGRPQDWPDFVAGLITRHRVTDLVLHGEQRPYHRAAAEVARARGVRIIVTELGYLRPDWMTLELDGTGSASHLPRTAHAIRALAAGLPHPDLAPRHATRFLRVALPDVVYNMSSSLLWFLFPHYRRHTIHYPPLEYAAWLWRLATSPCRNQRAARLSHRAAAGGVPLFVLPLQLDGDFQIRAHSPFPGQAAALEHVLASFAAAAPPAARLLVKTHPLENGLQRWPRRVRRRAAAHGLADRVDVIDGGSLVALWPHVAGLVTINSSAGLEAALAGVPVAALAPAIYAVPGLTHHGHLDGFWSEPAAPDPELARDLVRVIAGRLQVRGTIYSRDGLDAAVDNMARRILAEDFLTSGEGGAGGRQTWSPPIATAGGSRAPATSLLADPASLPVAP